MVLVFTAIIIMCTNILSVSSVPVKDESLENEVITYNFPFVRRKQWGALTPKQILPLTVPVPYVVIHHSFSPPACADSKQCAEAMRSMQDFHMNTRGWWDIGYNFAVGGNGAAYEGRGWNVLGAHSLHFNSVSLGICLIGDWSHELPPQNQLKTAKALIAAGIDMGYIKPDYKLIGHRQVRDTECPGDALFNEIQTWEHYSPFPNNAKDLINVVEIPDTIREEWKNNGTLVS
ncbi:peptidoglycan-recognition protein LB-like [Colias croceus]|uniref:peptidoglycan-recognition protein LB-like n=1 Tax=Colias crocea TaxID=72248 RepID=UPI001E27F0FD|nr:peptidoglycan-recognition protein LB-like [Colias croceus]XP_045503209.1 peptidoglycan-recognition protein LB-like [Colias croceus]